MDVRVVRVIASDRNKAKKAALEKVRESLEVDRCDTYAVPGSKATGGYFAWRCEVMLKGDR